MNIEELRIYCLSKRAAEESFPFDDVHLAFTIKGKMFALVPLDKATYVALKCDPDRAIELREQYSGVEPAFHFNKKYWNGVHLNDDVPTPLICELIDHSYNEVVKKLPKCVRQELDLIK